ncbi:MAG: hypothetical protein ACE5OZ_00005, partial [Candidatus Heimdallarchaeota archaeon]
VEPEAVEPEAVEPEAVEPEAVEPETIEPEALQTISGLKSEEMPATDPQPQETALAEEPSEEFAGAFGTLGHLAYQESETAEKAVSQEKPPVESEPDDLKGFSKLSSLLEALEDDDLSADSESRRVTHTEVSPAATPAGKDVVIGPPPPIEFDDALSEIDRSFSDSDLVEAPSSPAKKPEVAETKVTASKKEAEESPLKSLRSLITSLEEDEDEEW